MPVIDASIIGPLIISDEADDLHPDLHEVLHLGSATVPMHWRMEVAALGRKALRRKRISFGELLRALTALRVAGITEDTHTNMNVWGETLQLANRHDLTIYDAAYLELALRRKLSLMSTDRDLRAAAISEGVTLADA